MNKGALVVLLIVVISVGVYFGTKKDEDEDEDDEDSKKDDDDSKTSVVVPTPEGLYTIEQGIRHQGNNPSEGKTEDLWYHSNHGSPWNKYYKFSCVDEDSNESDKVGPYGPISFGNYGAPTIRFAPKGTKPCGENTLSVYRGEKKDGEYTAIHTGVKNAITGG